MVWIIDVCYICGKTLEPPKLKKGIFETKRQHHKLELRAWEKLLDKEMIADFTFWSENDVKTFTHLCRDCSLYIAQQVHQMRIANHPNFKKKKGEKHGR